jgi:hypothetical protein
MGMMRRPGAQALLLAAFLVALFAAPAAHAQRAIGPVDVYGTAGGGSVAGTAVSSTNTYYSLATDLSVLKNASYDVYWGTNVGTFTVQVSNKRAPVTSSDADWKALSLARPITQPSGTSGGDYVDLSWLAFKWVRLKYVNISGSGNIQAFMLARE